jgi:membrane protease YdiL (CAAX protease family)
VGPRLDGYELAAVGLTSAYSVVVNHVLPQPSHVPGNLAASGLLLLLARRAGVGVADLGLAPDAAPAALRTGAVAGGAVAAAITAAAALAPTRRVFVDDRVRDHTTGELAYHALLRIPIATALGEELVFRAALLGLFSRRRAPTAAVAVTSALFGLWHVLPTLETLGPEATPRRRAGLVAGVVTVTGAAGAAFAGLRLRSRSVLAPAVAHAALNVSALLAARFASRPRGRQA